MAYYHGSKIYETKESLEADLNISREQLLGMTFHGEFTYDLYNCGRTCRVYMYQHDWD